MSEEIEISVVLKLPKGHYQVATGLTRIYDYANFDEFVSDIMKENVETYLDGDQPLCSPIHHRLTGQPSDSTMEINKQMEPIIEGINQIKQQEQKEDNNKEATS
jgi:pantothenate kinase